MNPAPATRRGTEGFTLISVLIAVVILSTGLLALARAQGMLVATQTLTSSRTTAVTIARDYTEVLRSRDPWVIASEAAATVNSRGQADAAGKYTRSTSVTELAPNLLQVTVQVVYPKGRAPIQITTLIYRST
jgi:Tfp pilus assembly protein PilV